ncbi:c-type cytochrome [Cohnella sp. 56]|uniref:c-type cytochrome n=1 Tax=Cohnella sp. 56 TaxID=3113722 RepID=UPI0030EA2823
MQIYTSPRLPAVALVLLTTTLIVSACGGGQSARPAASAPASAALAGPAETVELYRSNCISCHGRGLEGKMGAASDLRSVGARLTKEQIARQIADGGELMPAMKDRLTEAQIDALAVWLSAKK